jgi:predicted GTPase
MSWDFFISHASEDKPLAREIAFALAKRGKRIWFDEFTLNAGDSLRRSIDFGLARSRFGIVILSPHFFAKEWPNKELDALVARDDGSEKVIIPIWHLVERQDVLLFSPTLADKLAINSQLPTHEIVRQILSASDQECTDEISLHLSILVLGATGSGKSALSRQLWHHPLMYTLDNGRIERTNALIHDESGRAYLIDYHILSCGDRSDEEFMESVARLANAVDIVLWVFTADARGFIELRLLKDIAGFARERIVIALNRVDLIGAKSWNERLWDEQRKCPTSEQQEQIDNLVDWYAEELNISKGVVVPTSVDREYGIDRLRDALLARRAV